MEAHPRTVGNKILLSLNWFDTGTYNPCPRFCYGSLMYISLFDLCGAMHKKGKHTLKAKKKYTCVSGFTTYPNFCPYPILIFLCFIYCSKNELKL